MFIIIKCITRSLSLLFLSMSRKFGCVETVTVTLYSLLTNCVGLIIMSSEVYYLHKLGGISNHGVHYSVTLVFSLTKFLIV